ncbi:hypothetical protein ABBQ32_000996 [Trebouxia sp. C0010 RCD-2024]
MSNRFYTSASSTLVRTRIVAKCFHRQRRFISSLTARRYPFGTAARPKFLSSLDRRGLCCNSHQHSTAASSPAVPASFAEWSGLSAWRFSKVDNRRVWGDKGPVARSGQASGDQDLCYSQTLAACAAEVLLTEDPKQKALLTHHAWQKFQAGGMPVGQAQPPPQPARPARPQLVPPKQVPIPKQSPLPLPVYMLHNLAHVELNAVDLAWDTVARFSHLGLDQGFYADFARVADDESRHLGWCLQRLEELGYAYGDMVAHSILWEGAQASTGDLAGRLAVVPMSQEARGLDAGPRLADKLVGCGDNRSAAIVSRIALEEKAHVAVGVSWFTKMAAAMGEDPGAVYRHCITSLGQQEALRPPYNHASREEVGLKQDWYDRSLWPSGIASGCAQAHTASAACSIGTQKEVQQQAITPEALQSLKQRMATVLDVELCSAK